MTNLKIVKEDQPADERVRLRILGPGTLRRGWRDLAPGSEFEVPRAELPSLAAAMAPRRSLGADGRTVENPPLVVVAADWDRRLAEEQRHAQEQAVQSVAVEQTQRHAARQVTDRRRMQAVEGDVARARQRLGVAETRLAWYDETIAQMRAEGAPPSRIADSEALRRRVAESVRIFKAEVANAEGRLADAQAAQPLVA